MTDGDCLHLDSYVRGKYIFILFKSLLLIFQSLQPQMTYSLIQQFSKYCARAPRRELSLRLFQEAHKVKIIFMKLLKLYLPFSLSFSHECVAKFLRGYLMITID